MKNISFSPLTLAVFGLLSSGTAFSAGFQLQNQNGAGTGLAFAGQAANAEDASTVFFNPAGMTQLAAGRHVTLAGTVIDRSIKFSDAGTTAVPTFALGNDGGNGGGVSVVPNFYYTQSLDARTVIGLGVSATYGSDTEYDPNFIGRFSGLYGSIKQININPSVGYKVSDKLSLGFGLNFAKNEVEFRQMVPVGPGLSVLASLKGDDSGWGWNAGALYAIDERTKIGVAYRSKIQFNLQGTQVVPGVLSASIRADLNTPDNLSLALSHKYSDKLEILADATRTGWASIQSLNVIGGSNPVLAYNFKNAWRYGVGAKYQYSGDWSLRTGLAYDQTPVPNAASRTMTLPDSDRIWLALGARKKLDEKSSMDMGYARIFLKDSQTARSVTMTGFGTQTVRGNFKSHVNLLSVQYNRQF